MTEIHQSKYQGTFKDRLQAAKPMEYAIIKALRTAGFFVRQYDEGQPFRDRSGNQMRLCDIEFFQEGQMMLFGECKDYCRMLYYDATGAPISYVQKLSIVNPAKLILFFRDNQELINALQEDGKQYVIQNMIRRGTLKQSDDGAYTFIPYGNFLSELMMEKNRNLKLESKVISHLSKYKNEPQYIWNTGAMLPLPVLIKHIHEVIASGKLHKPA